ncbi:hypothetical protein F2Q70_00004298 [Brassica cretica]|uniref:Uncharacterized protein n=1 Tax=Brassica cretica TaxID=69181 RepID=A0A8S9ISV0_BRACR|nr:hypothetical protein F2Q68_00021219 [Brassica cretica]KAF2572844.1 hypothetical protein F2Q70_00004298 [Brassica cretica]
MARLVRVFKGQWLKSQQGVWRFEEDPTIGGRDILIGKTEQHPQWMLEPDEETWPPHNINTNADIDMMMSVHEWNVEPKLCVICGAEDVATYQFRCRAPFTIRSITFLGDGVPEKQQMAIVLDMIRGNEIVCSDHVLNELFDEQKMVLLYRFSLEIEKAKTSLNLNLANMVETDDHIVPNVGNADVETHAEAGGVVVNTEINAAAETGHVPFNNPTQLGFHSVNTAGYVRASLPPTMYDPHYYTPQWGTMDVTGRYWDNLMSSRYAVELQRIYGVPGSEYVGYGPNDLNIGNPIHPHLQASPSGPLMHGYEVPIEVSSTASSTEVKEVNENGGNLNTSKLTGAGAPISVDKGESSNRAVAATHGDFEVKFQLQDGQPRADDDGSAGGSAAA